MTEPASLQSVLEQLAEAEKQVAQLKGDKALLSAEKGESQERAARLADAAARTSAPASAGLARGSGSAVKSSVDSAEARRRTSAADVMSLVRGEDLRAVVDEAGSASPMEKLGALMQDAEADESRPPTDAELAELRIRQAEQQKKDGYVERWLKKRGGQAMARRGPAKGDVPTAAPTAQASRQVREEIGRLAATATAPVPTRHPDDTDDEDGSDFYFSEDEK